MFARVTPSGYVAIYESYHDKAKRVSRQRTIKSLGSVKALKEQGIDDPLAYAKSLIPELEEERRCEKEAQKGEIDGYEKIGDTDPCKNMGQYFLRSIDDSFNLANTINVFSLSAVSKKARGAEILQDLVVARAIDPCSKKKTYTQVIPTLRDKITYSLDDLYSALEFFGANYKRFVGWYREIMKDVYTVDTSQVYFDCTNY